jgi:hypothetical protein
MYLPFDAKFPIAAAALALTSMLGEVVNRKSGRISFTMLGFTESFIKAITC